MSNNKKIRVLHLTYDMRIGGTEQVIKKLVENSDKESIFMSILCIESPPGPFAKELQEQGISVTSLKRTPGFDWKLISSIRRYLRSNRIDILHCHQYTPWVYGVLAAFMSSVKVVFTEHGRFYPDSSTWKRRWINPWLHRITDRTTAISSATRQALADYENIPFNDIDVIYNGISPLQVDNERVSILRRELGLENVLCMGTIARFDPIKNHPMMLQAFRKVLDKGIRCKLLIVGDGEMRPEIEKVITSLALEEHVLLTGYKTDAQDYLALMDIYLLSSFSEGTSMTLLEAMSIGRPCVVTHAGGNPEIIHHQKNGYVTPNDDADAFSDAILNLVQNNELLAEMGRNSRKLFCENYTSAIMCERFRQLYISLSS